MLVRVTLYTSLFFWKKEQSTKSGELKTTPVTPTLLLRQSFPLIILAQGAGFSLTTSDAFLSTRKP